MMPAFSIEPVSRRFQRSVWILLSPWLPHIALSLLSVSAAAKTLEVSGIVTVSGYVGHHDSFQIGSNWFRVTLDEYRSCIIVGGGSSSNISHFEYGLMGEDSYEIAMFDTNRTVSEYFEVRNGIAKKIKVTEPIKPINDAMVTLNQGAVPESGNGFITPVWLAYSFGIIFTNQTRGHMKLAPFTRAVSRFRRLGGEADIEYKLHSSAPYQLDALTQTLSSKAFRRLGLPMDFGDKFTNYTYQATCWTNIEGWSLPCSFRVVEYAPESKAASVSRVAFEGIVTGIKPGADVPLLSVPRISRVIERRQAYVTPYAEYSYTTLDGKLWNMDLLRAKGQHDPRPVRFVPSYGKLWTIYGIFAVVLLAPIFLLARNSWLKRRQRIS